MTGNPLSLSQVLLGGALLLLLSSSCEKREERLLGKDAIPEKDRLHTGTRDSFQIASRTVSMPSVPAVNSVPGMLGKLKDPRTGVTRAALFSQILLPGSNIDLGDPQDLELDSVVLSLRYGGYYGDTSTAQEFQVHQVLESMDGIDPDHTDSLSYSVTAIGAKNSTPKLNKQVHTQEEGSLPPHLRIRLKDAFGKNILDRSGGAELSDDDAFTSFINGIMITSRTQSPGDNEGAVLFTEIPHDDSRVTLYYRNTAENDTSTLELSLDGTHFNQVSHDPQGSDLSFQIGDSFSKERENSYILGPGAYATELRFPSVKDLNKDGPVAINRARLYLPVNMEGKSSDLFPPSVTLHALYEDGEGELRITKDRLEEGAGFFGGSFENKNHRYTLKITRHIQAILNGEVEDARLFITTSLPMLNEAAANTVSRAVLKGPGANKTKPFLEVTYTEQEDPS